MRNKGERTRLERKGKGEETLEKGLVEERRDHRMYGTTLSFFAMCGIVMPPSSRGSPPSHLLLLLPLPECLSGLLLLPGSFPPYDRDV